MTSDRPREPTALDAARHYVKRGWAPIPVPFREKGPLLKRWQKLRLSEEQLAGYFNCDAGNIGVLLGVPSGGLVDVDLDAPEAVQLARCFLPPTACVFGRPGKPHSHRLYRTTPIAVTTKYTAPDGTMLLEVRSTGAQTVFPPSVHPTGETVAWDQDDEPALEDGRVLVQYCNRLAAASLFARHWPEEGGRQAAALALAGGLLRAGWPEEEVVDFVRDVAVAAEDDEPKKRADAAIYTAKRLERDRPATGWPALADLIGTEVVGQARQWLGLAESGARKTAKQASQATLLVQIAADVELFHTPGGDAETYATIRVGDHRETLRVKSRAFLRWLCGQFWKQHGKAAAAQTVQEALTVIGATALFEGPERPVAVRLSEYEAAIWLDLGNANWEAVEITSDGWQVAGNPPVRFIRPRGVLPLPTPVAGGSIDALRRFVNVGCEDDWILVKAFLVAALRPRGPYPVLVLNGEQGSAKSTMCRVFRACVDPNQAPLRAEPRDARDLMIAASNSWLLGLDNLSRIPPWLSDALCRLATGGGFGVRELYSDGDEKIFDAMRPVIVNGIEDVAVRGDLLDRAIHLALPPVLPERRRPEADFWREFSAARPQILGALLDAVSTALRNVSSVRLAVLPRMADFAVWSVAAESALGIREGAFLRAYTGNRETANATAIESTVVGPMLLQLACEHSAWAGTATELLAALESCSDERTRARQGWPKSPRTLANTLRRLAPNLRQMGTEVTFTRRADRNRTRVIRLHQAGAEPSEPSGPSEIPSAGPENGASERTQGRTQDADGAQNRPQGEAACGPANADVDAPDAADAETPAGCDSSGALPEEPDALGRMVIEGLREFDEREGPA